MTYGLSCGTDALACAARRVAQGISTSPRDPRLGGGSGGASNPLPVLSRRPSRGAIVRKETPGGHPPVHTCSYHLDFAK